MSVALKKLKTRIAQLLAMANSTTHPEEAASFAAKARQLMDEHGISLGEAVADQNPLGETESHVKYTDGVYKVLATVAARYFGCETLFWPGETRFSIYGREAARVTAELMIPYWTKECTRLGNELAKETGMKRRQAIHTVMSEFSRRLHNLTVKDPAQAVHSSLPVPVDEAKSIMPDGRTQRVKSHSDERAAELAKGISVTRQAGGSAAQQMIGA